MRAFTKILIAVGLLLPVAALAKGNGGRFSVGLYIYIITAFYGGIFGYPILQFFAIRRMHGKWRALALLPLLPMLPVLIATLQRFYGRSELPVWVYLVFVPAILAYLVILLVVYGVVQRKPRD